MDEVEQRTAETLLVASELVEATKKHLLLLSSCNHRRTASRFSPSSHVGSAFKQLDQWYASLNKLVIAVHRGIAQVRDHDHILQKARSGGPSQYRDSDWGEGVLFAPTVDRLTTNLRALTLVYEGIQRRKFLPINYRDGKAARKQPPVDVQTIELRILSWCNGSQ